MNCLNCQSPFRITNEDRIFYEKASPIFNGQKYQITDPKLCPDCRQKRRLSFRNERGLYRRTCNATLKNIISIYRQDSSYTVYSSKKWWSDDWDALAYGREFDFSRPFFEQFNELKQSVPHIALHNTNNENSDYINLSGYNKNCYLIFAAEYNEDCLYGTQFIKSGHCIDGLNCLESKYCYEVVDVKACYQLFYSQECENCSESMFLYNCRNVSNSLFCSNLVNKQYCIFNQQYDKNIFQKKATEILKRLRNGELDVLRKEFKELKKQTPHRALSMNNCESSNGNFLTNCKNCFTCFDLAYGEDCRYVYTGYGVKDIMDVCHATEAELAYESTSIGYQSYNILFCNGAWTSSNVLYSDNIHTSKNIFGCSNLKKQEYCILNKKYNKEQYEALTPKIIQHMQNTGEWGEFFPSGISPFTYEDTKANEYFPTSLKKEIYQRNIPEGSIICEITGRPFVLTKAEKKFYKQMGLSLPKRHPDQRHKEQFNMMPPRKLIERECSKCKNNVSTPFDVETTDKIYCEQCYLSSIY